MVQGAPSVVMGGGAVGATDLLKATAGECFTANMAAPPDELAAKVWAAATQWDLKEEMLIGPLKATARVLSNIAFLNNTRTLLEEYAATHRGTNEKHYHRSHWYWLVQ